MNKYAFLLISVLLLFSFKTYKKTEPILIYVKGTAINLYTKKPLKKTEIILNDDIIDPHRYNYEKSKTNSKGEFIIYASIIKRKSNFWLFANEFAQINFINAKYDAAKTISDTIDLGKVYFVPYSTELKTESYNMPKMKKEKIIRDCFSIKQVDSIFSNDTNAYHMKIKSIDTIEGMRRYSYVLKKDSQKRTQKGTTEYKYKVLTFIRDLK